MEFDLPAIQHFQLVVYDLTGRVVMHREGQGQQGANTLLLETGHIASGLYLVEFRSEQFKALNRLMVQK